MSEIKGQLLGMILVLLLFAAVATAMIAIFSNSTAAINERMDSIISMSASFH